MRKHIGRFSLDLNPAALWHFPTPVKAEEVYEPETFVRGTPV